MRKILVEHIERVEGHGSLEINIEDKMVKDVKFIVNEGPRLVEKLVIGKSIYEVLNIVPRICAICSVSHRYAAIKALENALNIKVNPIVCRLRELMHLGEIIESNSLHVFLLSLPDLFGFSSAISMYYRFSKEIALGLRLKNFGNEVMEIITGRAIHGENPVLGQFGKYPSKQELKKIKEKAEGLLVYTIEASDGIKKVKFPDYPEYDTVYAALEPVGDNYGFVGDEIIVSDGQRFSIQEYKNFAEEKVIEYSYAKHSLYKQTSYTVGALARINLLGERLKGDAFSLYKKYYKESWKGNPFYNIIAQMIEIVYSLERIIEVIREIESEDIEIEQKDVQIQNKNGAATGAVEAPRGTLLHYYEIKNGNIFHADIVTPTAQNAKDIEKYCKLYAQYLIDNNLINDVETVIRKLIRAFDPCISCSVH